MCGPHTAPTRHELRLPGAQSGELSNTTRPCLVSAPRLMRREIRIRGSTTSSGTTLMCRVNSHKYETLREQTSIYSLRSKVLLDFHLSKNGCTYILKHVQIHLYFDKWKACIMEERECLSSKWIKDMYLELKYVQIHLLLSILMTSSTSYPKELYIQRTQNIRSTVGNY